MSFLRCGSLPSRFAPYGDSGILFRVARSPYYKPPARPLGLLRQCLLHCQHGHRSFTYAGNFVYGLYGLPPTAQMAQSQHVCGQHSSTQSGPVGRVWPPACVTSSSGRTSLPGDPRSNPQSAGTDRPCCLLSTAPYGVSPGRTGLPGCLAGRDP